MDQALYERVYDRIRRLPREDLEAFALRAAVHIRLAGKETEEGRFFRALLTGFILGALVAAAGFLLGIRLG